MRTAPRATAKAPPYTVRAQDQIAYTLLVKGPMTLEELATWMKRDNYAVNTWLYQLRQRGIVRLVEKGEHRNSRGMRCGKWALNSKEQL